MSVDELLAGLGIQYAVRSVTIGSSDTSLRCQQFFTTGTPSSLKLGGKFELFDFKGAMVLHTGTDPRQQLLDLAIRNLDVAKLLKLIGNLLDLDITISESRHTFYIWKFAISLSTGIQVKKAYFPRGIRLEADVALFGKTATLSAEVSEDRVKFRGTV
jgi:hypothetical protein